MVNAYTIDGTLFLGPTHRVSFFQNCMDYMYSSENMLKTSKILHWMATHFRIHIPLLNNLSKLWDAQNFLNFPVSFNSFFMPRQICLSYYYSCILGDSFNMKPLSVGCQSSWKIDCVVASCSLDLQRKNPETYERYCKVILAHDSPRSSVYHMQEPAYHMQHIIISNTFS